ncbi:unnamed protein product [Adineta steineri]|uniref:PiggyBac transposable element-derived protein domain-containing protein n=1 Tax=Adineta steineri TaxID=433720 RepID=A0A815BMT1_9BILA|nr:unnamed protein product [Adineta steineri]CAF1555375.1 unnamed protein product [Adineta steineri]
MDCDQESTTSDSSVDDKYDFYNENESDLEIDDEETTMETENEEEAAEIEEKEEDFELNWSQNFIQDTIFPSDDIKGHTSITSTNNIKPIDIYNKFFTKDIIQLIVKQTNIYGKQKSLAQQRPNNWKEVGESIIRSFLGILIIMGLHRLPQIRDYWRIRVIQSTRLHWFTEKELSDELYFGN